MSSLRENIKSKKVILSGSLTLLGLVGMFSVGAILPDSSGKNKLNAGFFSLMILSYIVFCWNLPPSPENQKIDLGKDLLACFKWCGTKFKNIKYSSEPEQQPLMKVTVMSQYGTKR